MIAIPQIISRRKSEGFNPGKISEFWGAARLESYANNDPVTTITNFGAGGVNATAQATEEPTFVTNAFGSYPAFQADGVDDNMSFNKTFNSEVFNQPQWGFVFVDKLLSTTTTQHYVGSGSGTVSKVEIKTNGAYEIFIKEQSNAQDFINGGADNLNPHIVIFHVDFTNDIMQIEVDGVQVAAPGVVGDFIGNFAFTQDLALFTQLGNNFANRQLAEFNFGAFTLAQAQQCRDYYNKIYSIY